MTFPFAGVSTQASPPAYRSELRAGGAAVSTPHPRFLRNALILGLLTALGPLPIEVYLPSLPMIGASLDWVPIGR